MPRDRPTPRAVANLLGGALRLRVRVSALIAAAGVALVAPADAQTVTKASTGTELSASASWVGGTPGSGDVAAWDSASLGGALTLGSNLSWQGIQVSGATAAITLSGAGTLTLGSSGINLAGVNLTIANSRTFSSDSSITVGAGRILTFNSGTTTYAAGTTTTFAGPGEVQFGSTGNTITGSGNLVLSGGILRNNLQAEPTFTGFTGGVTLGGGAAFYQNSTASLFGAATVTVGAGGAIIGGGSGANGNRSLSSTLVLVGDLTVQNEGSSNSQTTLSGAKSGSGGIIKNSTGTGSLILSGANTYTGATVVNAGTLSLTGSLSGSNVSTTGSAVFSQAAAGSIAGAGVTFTQGSSGTSVLGGANTYTGATVVNAGTLSLTGSLSGSNVSTTGSAVFSQAAAGSIAGAGVTFTQGSSGTSVLGGANTYTGATVVNAGTLSLTGTLAGTTLQVGGGTFSHARAASQTLNGLVVNVGASTVVNTNSGTTNVLSLGNITRARGSGTVNFSTASATGNVITTSGGVINGIIGPWATRGSDWATKDGSGYVVAYSAYTDVTRMDSGTKVIADGSSSNVRIIDGTGTAGNLTLGAATTAIHTLLQSATGGATTVDASAGTLRLAGIRLVSGASALTVGTSAGSGTVTAASAGGELVVINDSTANALTLNSVVANHTSASYLTKLGAGTLVLGGANTFSGGTVLGAGTLQVNQTTGLGSGSLAVNGGTLTTAANQVTLTNAITLNANVSFTGTAGTQGMRLDGLISGSGGFSKDGTGRVTLTNGANSFTGGVTINDGILAVTNSALSSAGSVNILGPTGGGLALGINGTTVINNLSGGANGRVRTDFNITGGDGARTLHVIQSVDGEFAGQTLHSATRVLTLLKSGAATLTLSGANAHQGGTVIRQGTIIANNASGLGAAGTVTLNDASTGASNTSLRLGSVTVARAITVANQGTGVTTLGANGSVATPEFSGAITLAKNVTLDGSTVTDRLTFSGGIGGTGNVTIAGTGRVVFNTTASTYVGITTVSAGSILQLGVGGSIAAELIPSASVVNLGAGSFLKLAKLSNNETIGGLTGTGTVRGHEAVAGAASSLTISNTGTHSFGGVLENGGASGSTLALIKSGSGTQVLTGANTFTGGVTVTAGTLALSGSGTLGAGTVTVTGGTLDLGGVASAASIVLNGGSLAGASAYAGALSVSGNSAVSGAIGGTFGSGTAGTEVVTVAAGTSFTGTLKGIGTLSGDVTLAANSTHAPGNSPGVQAVTGDLTYANQTTVQWELIANSEAGRGASFDGIDVGGDLTLGSAPNGVTLSLVFAGAVDWSNAFWSEDRSWLLYDVAGTTAGFSNLQISSSFLDASGDLLTDVRSLASFGLEQVGSDIRINYAVPEPSTYGLALGALALAGAALRRRRKG